MSTAETPDTAQAPSSDEGPTTAPIKGWLDAALLLAVVAFGLFLYRGVLTMWFTTTDALPLIESARVTSAADLVRLFTEPLMAGTAFTEGYLYYRPLSALSFAIDYALWGLDPAGYHLTSLVLHGACIAGVYLVVRQLGGSPSAPAKAALLFSLHPALAETVPAIARRQDSLSVALFLGAFMLMWRAKERGGWGPKALSVAAFVAAALAKEVAFVFPVVALFAAGGDLRERLRFSAPWWGAALALMAVRTAVLGGAGGAVGGTQTPALMAMAAFAEDLLGPSLVTFIPEAPSASMLGGATAAAALALLLFAGWAVETVRRAPPDARWDLEAATAVGGGFVVAAVGAYTLERLFAWQALAQGPGGVLSAIPADAIQPDRVYVEVILGETLGATFGLVLLALLVVSLSHAARRSPQVLVAAAIIALPMGLYAVAGVHGARLMTLPAAGLAVCLGLIQAPPTRITRQGAFNTFRDAILADIVIIPLWLTLGLSHLAVDLTHWQKSAEVSSEILGWMDQNPDSLPRGGSLLVVGLPITAYDLALAPGAPRSVSWLSDYAVKAWLDLRFAERNLYVEVVPHPLEKAPEALVFTPSQAEPDRGMLRITPVISME